MNHKTKSFTCNHFMKKKFLHHLLSNVVRRFLLLFKFFLYDQTFCIGYTRRACWNVLHVLFDVRL